MGGFRPHLMYTVPWPPRVSLPDSISISSTILLGSPMCPLTHTDTQTHTQTTPRHTSAHNAGMGAENKMSSRIGMRSYLMYLITCLFNRPRRYAQHQMWYVATDAAWFVSVPVGWSQNGCSDRGAVCDGERGFRQGMVCR